MKQSIEDKIRGGVVIHTSDDRDRDNFYRGLFIEGNFYIYRFVRAGRGYRGNFYECDGYVLAWSDVLKYNNMRIPSFVRLRA
jgi:hypothetical protein